MSDIKECWGCGEQFYMDNGTQCSACESEFCRACDYDNTICVKTKDGVLNFCLDCIRSYKENGIEWLRNEIYADDSDFNEQNLIDTIKEFEERNSNQ